MPQLINDGVRVLQMMGGFREACVIGSAAELGLFDWLHAVPSTADEVAAELRLDRRATRMLLDAVAALGLLTVAEGKYTLPDTLAPWLTAAAPRTIIPMILHTMNIMRLWAQLPWVTQSGRPAQRIPSIRGAAADRAAFVAAMHSISGPLAGPVVAKLQPQGIGHLLDVGGASGTWTLAFLDALPQARATIFDLPDAIEQARTRLKTSPHASRVDLVAGDFYADELPAGVDYAWVSAIIHQHDRAHNRRLFAKVFRALAPGGRIGIRDFVMQGDRLEPRDGALFAINMLVNTETGGTFTYEEIAADLQAEGFVNPRLAVPSEDMNAIVEAERPR